MKEVTQTATITTNDSQPVRITSRKGIEIYEVNTAIMGSHAVHWDALTDSPEQDVPTWLDNMIDRAVIPAGISPENAKQEMLLIATDEDVHVCQVFAFDEQDRPSELVTAFPCVNSPYGVLAKIERIIENTETNEAVLRLATPDGTTIYAYDALYAINKPYYQADCQYMVELSGICHTLEHFTEDEEITVTDEEAIRHHRALNDILTKNDGNVPDDLQEQLASWQPTNDEDTLPVTINLGKMCAYLYGEHMGQEDEAWCQGEVVGLQTVTNLEKALNLLDIVVLREEDTQPVVVRAVCAIENTPKGLQVGDFVRTNLWFQAKICTVEMKC